MSSAFAGWEAVLSARRSRDGEAHRRAAGGSAQGARGTARVKVGWRAAGHLACLNGINERTRYELARLGSPRTPRLPKGHVGCEGERNPAVPRNSAADRRPDLGARPRGGTQSSRGMAVFQYPDRNRKNTDAEG